MKQLLSPKSITLTFLGLIFGLALLLSTSAVTARPDQSLTYSIRAREGQVIREVTGEVTSYLNNVPAEPVDSFAHDGVGIVPVRGSVRVNIDPIENTGTIEANWKDENGRWTYSQSVFAPPDHATGLQIGASASATELIVDDPVTTNVYLHGDTTAGGPVLPTVFNLLATWGPAEVTLNGEPFENNYDGPTPLWIGHTMTSLGVRNDAGEVLTVDGDVFDPMNPGNGEVYDDEIEFHLVFHDAPGPDMTESFPPPHQFFYHLTFQNVRINIRGLN